MIEKYVNAEELRRLLSTMFVVLAALAIGALFAIIVVPGLRNANKPESPTPVSPVVGEPGWLDPAEFPPQRGGVVPPVDPKTLIPPSAALITRGKDLFTANCEQCHGDQGLGNGPAAGTMNPRPRNFTSSSGWTNGYNLPAIYRTLSVGVPDTSMASFNYLPRKDRVALAHFVQSLGKFPHGAGSPEALERLSEELASSGEKIPNRIPVSMAMARLEQEFTAAPPLAVAAEDHSPGAEIFRRIIQSPGRAAQVLAGSDRWRKGPTGLAASILPDVPGNGFSVSALTLSAEEWKQLHAELLKLNGAR
jgi:mono/diheme cytochrome c family protein